MVCNPMTFSLIFLKKWNLLIPGILEMESQDLSNLSFSDWIFSLEQCITLMLRQISAAISLNSKEILRNTRETLFFSLTRLSHQYHQCLLFHEMLLQTPMQQNPLGLSSSLMYIVV